jgi:O-glycosyl hydrolase
MKLDRLHKHDPADPNPDLFVTFMHKVAAKIREWDQGNHLITTGMISTRQAWLDEPEKKRKLYESPNLDFITIHAYQGENQEDDSPLANDLVKKPFIVEEAGFDAGKGEDRTQRVAEDMDKWFGRGASGYMQWGFMATRDNGDGDQQSGMDGDFHTDWDNLFNLYRQRAEALRNV